MICPTLQLKHVDKAVRAPVAWFLAGTDAGAWLQEICRWEISQKGMRLFVLALSTGQQKPVGVLVVPAQGAMPKQKPRGLAFGVIGGKLYLPVDAELWPPIEAHEIKLMHDVQIFHPALGLAGFAADEALGISDILRQPPSRVENWNFARTGAPINQHLRSVQLAAFISLKDLFGGAGDEIGSASPTELPPAPDEPGEGNIDKMVRGGRDLFNKGLLSILSQIPHTGSNRTWVNDLEDWAAKNLKASSKGIDSLRNKELNRLLHQLENDPELGLRHAIPLSGMGHRGTAPPASKLGTRDPNFDLSRLGGGYAADYWDVPAELQQQLRTKYRELANREMQLGRYRRAAYIFAELLGDLESAASTLKQGKHFAEAAKLYKDHLRRPREAAKCLAEGGQFMDAIAIYEQEQSFLEVGQLYLQLGRTEDAMGAFRREVEKYLRANDFVTAARLTENELGSPREALGILTLGSQHQLQSMQCLQACFDLMARKSWHEEACELVSSLRKQSPKADRTASIAQLLSAQSAHYPDHAVRGLAADAARVLIGGRLQTAPPSEALQLTNSLVKLAPEDRLLARDAIRFMAARNEALRKQAKTPPPAKPAGVSVLVRTFDLSKGLREGFTLHTVKSCGAYFFALGYTKKESVLLRGNWEGMMQTIAWANIAALDIPLYMEVDETTSPPAMVIVSSSPVLSKVGRMPEKVLPAADAFGGEVPAGTPDWLAGDFLALCWRGNLAWLLRRGEQNLVLECRHKDGRVIMNAELDGVHPDLGDTYRHVSLLVQREMVWVAINRKLFLHRPGKSLRQWEAESDVLSLHGSAPHLPLCAVTRLQQGVALHWFDALEEEVSTLCADLASPLACFTASGTLVLLSENEGRICEVGRDGKGESPFSWPGEKPHALVRAQNANEFAVFTQAGKVQLFRVQSRR
jgi:tetratricopeptide (TPR) repeat protein